MKKTLLLMAAMLFAVAANAWTVYYTNPNNWDEVAIWAWDTNNGDQNCTGGVWPGKLMTKQDNGIYVYTGEGTPTKVIFNNNDKGQQTTDLPFQDGATYPMSDVIYRLHGNITNESDEWNPIILNYNAGVFESDPWVFVPGNFGLQKYAESDTKFETQIGWVGGNATIDEAGKTYSFTEGDNSTSNLRGAYVVVYNPTANTIAFNPHPGKVSYAIHGSIFAAGSDWNSKDMTEENGIWSYTGDIQSGDFGIKEMIDGNQVRWIYADGDGNKNLNVGTLQARSEMRGWGSNWNNKLTGRHMLTFDPANYTLSVSIPSGVAEIETAETETEYFNLQGIRVAEPAQGLYIVRRGNKVTKELIR